MTAQIPKQPWDVRKRRHYWKLGKGEVRVLGFKAHHYFKNQPNSLGCQLAKATPMIILIKH